MKGAYENGVLWFAFFFGFEEVKEGGGRLLGE
jgi:hypothetical protein